MSFRKTMMAVLILGTVTGQSAHAAPVLYDWGFNLDGTTYCDFGPCDNDAFTGFGAGDLAALGVDVSGFDFDTGLGDVTVTVTGDGLASDRYVSMFVDHEVDETTNTFFNESGEELGTPEAGQRWEIDEPGFGSTQDGTAGVQYFGDIFANFGDSDASFSWLDNDIFYDSFDGQYINLDLDDVAMALDWSFSLAADEIATIVFNLSETDPGSGFRLRQSDTETDAELYFYSSLTISAVGVPEPGTLSLLLLGLVGLVLHRRAAA